MFGLFGDPIGTGVKKGLDRAFSPGGGAYEAFGAAIDKGLMPFRDELDRLRRIEARYKWHPLAAAKPWVFDGRTMLVFVNGDMMFAAYRQPEGEDAGYWDADIEYGGTPVEPQPSHFYILRKVPAPAVAPSGGA